MTRDLEGDVIAIQKELVDHFDLLMKIRREQGALNARMTAVEACMDRSAQDTAAIEQKPAAGSVSSEDRLSVACEVILALAGFSGVLNSQAFQAALDYVAGVSDVRPLPIVLDDFEDTHAVDLAAVEAMEPIRLDAGRVERGRA